MDMGQWRNATAEADTQSVKICRVLLVVVEHWKRIQARAIMMQLALNLLDLGPVDEIPVPIRDIEISKVLYSSKGNS